MKQLVRSLLGNLGYQISRTNKSPWHPLFSSLKSSGFTPKHIIDVGANHGDFTRAASEFFPGSLYTLVEPQDQLKSYIEDLIERGIKINWINAGAADKPGKLLFTISYRDDGSTFGLTEAEAKSAGYKQIVVEVKTLNEIVSGGGTCPEIVKIDAEGFDLKVLSGASNLLGKTDLFFVEASVCASFSNTASEVIKWMAAAGYRLVDITDLNRSPKYGVLWLCELAFLRIGSNLLEAAKSYE